MFLEQARAPEDSRIYAIGDVHGCDAMLGALHQLIRDDLAAHPVARHRVVHLGDYVDRGPDSAGVIERLIALRKRDPDAVFLRGNHDQKFLDFLDDPAEAAMVFLTYGGHDTLRSYGVRSTSARDPEELAAEARHLVPETHLEFLGATELSATIGDFFLCHAGVDPDVPLELQVVDDLMWIREPFLESEVDFGKVVVHGHTPVSLPVAHRNRIACDTGAVFGGTLTVAALDDDVRFLQIDQALLAADRL